MRTFDLLGRFLARFKHPVSLPDDIAQDLGVELPNRFSYEQCISKLTCQNCIPKKLKKYMPREEVDAKFHCACRQEHFPGSSIYTYCFSHGLIILKLNYDDSERLRRIYVQYQESSSDEGVELPLLCDHVPAFH